VFRPNTYLRFKKGKLILAFGIKGIVTKNKTYTVLLIKDKFFPEGEECILGNNKEYVTLDCFKGEIKFDGVDGNYEYKFNADGTCINTYNTKEEYGGRTSRNGKIFRHKD